MGVKKKLPAKLPSLFHLITTHNYPLSFTIALIVNCAEEIFFATNALLKANCKATEIKWKDQKIIFLDYAFCSSYYLLVVYLVLMVVLWSPSYFKLKSFTFLFENLDKKKFALISRFDPISTNILKYIFLLKLIFVERKTTNFSSFVVCSYTSECLFVFFTALCCACHMTAYVGVFKKFHHHQRHEVKDAFITFLSRRFFAQKCCFYWIWVTRVKSNILDISNINFCPLINTI